MAATDVEDVKPRGISYCLLKEVSKPGRRAPDCVGIKRGCRVPRRQVLVRLSDIAHGRMLSQTWTTEQPIPQREDDDLICCAACNTVTPTASS